MTVLLFMTSLVTTIVATKLTVKKASKELFCFTDAVRRYAHDSDGTSLGRPVDILGYETATVFKGNYAKVEARSIVVLQAKRD